jgi:hypothetical protein
MDWLKNFPATPPMQGLRLLYFNYPACPAAPFLPHPGRFRFPVHWAIVTLTGRK